VISAGSVVLVLLAIVAGAFIWNANREPAPAIIPLHSETTAGGVVIQTILEEHVPSGMLPGDPTKWIASFKFSLEPGEAWRDKPSPCQLARQYVVGIVESGTLAMVNTGPFEVTRSDGTTESIQAGERADLRAGDSWVYLSDRTETNVQKWNPGTAPVVAYQTDWALDESCESTPLNPEWLWHDSTYGATFDPARPAVVTFEQVFVQPGAMISWEDAARIGFASDESVVFSVIGVESGTIAEAIVPEALLEPTLSQQEPVEPRIFGPGEAWSSKLLARPLDEGFEREFRAGDDEPLVLTVIAWSYDDAVPAEEPVPAVVDGIERRALIEQHFGSDAVPRDTDRMFVMNRAVVPAGETVAYPESCGSPMLVAAAVESGSYAIRAESQIDVTRADGTAETIERGTPVELGAGDSFVYANITGESLSEFRNAGSEPLAIVQAIWFPEASCTYGPTNSEDRSQIVWITYDRLPALQVPLSFDLEVQHVRIPNFQQLRDEEFTGFAVSQFPNDNLARMAIESGSVVENVVMVTGGAPELVFEERYGATTIVSLDGPLVLGENFERTLTTVGPGGPTGDEPVEVTAFSLIYETDTG
jgi:hypothetical protein